MTFHQSLCSSSCFFLAACFVQDVVFIIFVVMYNLIYDGLKRHKVYSSFKIHCIILDITTKPNNIFFMIHYFPVRLQMQLLYTS